MVFEQVLDLFSVEADPTYSQWFMMLSCYPIVLITLGYLCFIYIVGRRYMINKPPYELKSFILCYNMMQILVNAWIVSQHIRSGYITKYIFMCQILDDQSYNKPMLANAAWLYMLLKIVDYVETCMFVLRKKQNQVTVLHVYHHISLVVLSWLTLRYSADQRMTFPAIINSFVHVIMYTYYFCTAYGPRLQRIVAPVKSYMTIIQIIQLFGILVYQMQLLLPSCEKSKGIILMCNLHVVNVLINIILFSNFYKKNYIKVSKQEIKSRNNFIQKSQ